MSPKHGPWRAQIIFLPTARQQITALTDNDRARLDPVLVAISRAPHIGALRGDGATREYVQDDIRVFYFATELGAMIIVAYVEA